MKLARNIGVVMLLCQGAGICANTPINNGLLQSDMNGNQKRITNLADVVTTTLTVSGQSVNVVVTNGVDLLNGFDMVVAAAGANTNFYWWDFGRTNSNGQKVIYGYLTATNDVAFYGPTNHKQWSLLSYNVVASGANRRVYIPSTLPHFNTNGFVLGGGYYYFTLTNGNEFRMSIQSNRTLSTIWSTFGQ